MLEPNIEIYHSHWSTVVEKMCANVGTSGGVAGGEGARMTAEVCMVSQSKVSLECG